MIFQENIFKLAQTCPIVHAEEVGSASMAKVSLAQALFKFTQYISHIPFSVIFSHSDLEEIHTEAIAERGYFQ